MTEPDPFTTVGGFAAYRPVAHVSLAQGIEMVTAAITRARERGIRKLLVNTCGFTGVESPGLGARYFFVHEWARAAGGQLTLAMVARPEMIDPQKFGVNVAIAAGLQSDVFPTEEEAVAWLRQLG
jgi:hypothetical protein